MRSFIKRVKKLIRLSRVKHVTHVNEELNEICKECKCICNTKRFQQNFQNWTSGNNDIDKFIKNTQLSSHSGTKNVLEWIPYDRFYDIKYIKENRFSKVYRAIWIDGCIDDWDNGIQNWERSVPYLVVALKSLNNSTLEFLNEIKINHEFYGITQDPEKKNYMMVLNYRYGIRNM